MSRVRLLGTDIVVELLYFGVPVTYPTAVDDMENTSLVSHHYTLVLLDSS